jgi:alpha-tubulin suppressor-like RCC1 family protein
MATTKGAWKLQEVRDQILAGEWVQYDQSLDPGTLWAWGCNDQGQLGDGTVIRKSSPIQIPGTQWNDIANGRGFHSLARKDNGTLWSWGYNATGQLGESTFVPKSSPTQIPGTLWSGIAGGSKHSLARKTDGTLWSWGYNARGELGIGCATGVCSFGSPVQVPGTQWNDVAAGHNHSLARKTNGTLWAWGCNNQSYCGGPGGQLGDGTIIDRSSPVQIPGTQWSDIDAGICHTLARKTDGTLWAWGSNGGGVLGDNTTVHRNSPIQVPGTQWNDVAAGKYHSLARKTDGTLWSWGFNRFAGALGENYPPNIGGFLFYDRSSPVQVPGTQWSDIAASYIQSFARKTNGTLWSWGDNRFVQLGDNTTAPRSSPVQVPGNQWNDVAAAGCRHTLARKLV